MHLKRPLAVSRFHLFWFRFVGLGFILVSCFPFQAKLCCFSNGTYLVVLNLRTTSSGCGRHFANLFPDLDHLGTASGDADGLGEADDGREENVR